MLPFRRVQNNDAALPHNTWSWTEQAKGNNTSYHLFTVHDKEPVYTGNPYGRFDRLTGSVRWNVTQQPCFRIL